MKKILLCLLVLGLLTGCTSYREIAKDNFDENILKECVNYETVISNYYGGGEGESRGYAEIGYCDNELVYSISRVDSIFSRKTEFYKNVFKLPETGVFSKIFGENLFEIDIKEGYDGQFGYSLKLVVFNEDLDDVVFKIQNEVASLFAGSLTPVSISITIFTTNEIDLSSEKVKISYIMNNNYQFNDTSNDVEKESYYDILEYSGYIDGYSSEDLINSLNDYKVKYNLN